MVHWRHRSLTRRTQRTKCASRRLRKSMMHVAPSSPDLGERLKAGWNDSEKPKPIIGLVPIGADPGMQLRRIAEELAIQFIPIRLS